LIAIVDEEMRDVPSLDDPVLGNEADLPPAEPVIGNDANGEPGDTAPLDGAPVPTLTEPGDTNGG
jgi:hypothetical protein